MIIIIVAYPEQVIYSTLILYKHLIHKFISTLLHYIFIIILLKLYKIQS